MCSHCSRLSNQMSQELSSTVHMYPWHSRFVLPVTMGHSNMQTEMSPQTPEPSYRSPPG